jgi:hypothetical protein
MPPNLLESSHKIVQQVVDGAAVALKPVVTGGGLGGELLAIVVSVLRGDDVADAADAAVEIWHGHIADLPEADWPEDSYAIARGKTALTVRTGLTAEEVHKVHPELLAAGDVPWWGNTLIDIGGRRVIVSASGLDEQWDQRICEAIADLLVISFAAEPDLP